MIGAPQIQHADEVGLWVGEHCVRSIGLLACIGGTFARILHAEKADDGQHLAQAVQLLAFDQHARQLHVDRNFRQHAADGGELARLVDGRDFGKPPITVGHHARIGRFEKWEVLDLAQLQCQHAQYHVGQRRTQQLGISERCAAGVVGLVIQAIADACRHATAATLALIGRRLRDRFDMQPFELAALAVALHPRGAGIDHIADARHGERGLCHVGGQHHAAFAAGFEHAILIAGRQPRVQRHDFGLAVLTARQQQVRIADFTFAGQEHQHVAARVVMRDFIQHGCDVFGTTLLHIAGAALLIGG